MRQAAGGQHRLGLAVLAGQAELGGVCAQHAGVGQQRHAGGTGRVDHRAVLRGAAAQLARGDQQHLLGAGEGGLQRLGLLVVGLADLHAQRGQIGSARRLAHRGDQGSRRGAALEQRLDDEAAELAGGTGDDDHELLQKQGRGIDGRHAAFQAYFP